jgi:hypothetical protein
MDDSEKKTAERLAKADAVFVRAGQILKGMGFSDIEISDAMLIAALGFMQRARGTAWCAGRLRILAFGLERTAAAEGKPGEPARPN